MLELQNGAIEFFCTYYKKDVERLEIRFFLRPVGSAWDTANDPQPPAYWDTVEEETH